MRMCIGDASDSVKVDLSFRGHCQIGNTCRLYGSLGSRSSIEKALIRILDNSLTIEIRIQFKTQGINNNASLFCFTVKHIF